jgi:lysophospholipid acyltransferase (LPLAT)-like uncharacterized protein
MEPPVTAAEEREAPSIHYDTRPPELSRWRRMQIPLIAAAGWSLVRAIGPTLRFEVHGYHHIQRAYDAGRRFIGTFWHECIFASTWWWRDRGIVVLNSTNFDGQWTRRVIERFGFATAQGSSSRGGLRGLAEMARQLETGRDVAFTIDGPRGPRQVAKPGPAMLARRTASPIMCFHIGLENRRVMENTWDRFQLPRPYSRAVMLIAPLIEVPPDAGRERLEQKHQEMQAALERARDAAESWFAASPAERDRRRAEWGAGA